MAVILNLVLLLRTLRHGDGTKKSVAGTNINVLHTVSIRMSISGSHAKFDNPIVLQ